MSDKPIVKSREERDKEFIEWKQDLDRRCSEHLKANPEKRDEIRKPRASALRSLLPARTKIRVDVVESISHPGVWYLFKNGLKILTFMGKDAHEEALKHAKVIAENE